MIPSIDVKIWGKTVGTLIDWRELSILKGVERYLRQLVKR